MAGRAAAGRRIEAEGAERGEAADGVAIMLEAMSGTAMALGAAGETARASALTGCSGVDASARWRRDAPTKSANPRTPTAPARAILFDLGLFA
jgi:hypothetical protein